MNRFEAYVYDDRDAQSPEPASTLGEFPTMEEALDAIRTYLKGVHGQHISQVQVVRR